MRRANAALAPRQRLVLALRELEDRSYAEIGELVGLKENAVAQLISRARQSLREELRLVEVDRSKLPEECQALLPLLSSYLDGQLKGVAAERTVAHLEACELCQKALTEMREASRLYRALLPIPFPELFTRIDDALASNGFWEPAAALRGLARSKGAWIAAGAAIVGSVALVVVLGVLRLGGDSEPAAAQVQTQPPTEVADTLPPELTLPQGTVRREASSEAGAPVSFAVGAEDAVDGSVEATCSPAAGEVLPIGTTEVACAAQDTSGNDVAGTFAVEVVDSTPPVITAPTSVEAEAKGPEGTPVSYRARAQDRADSGVSVGCAPPGGTLFPLGETSVECTARDEAGNVSRQEFTVTVLDSTPPALTLPAAIAVEEGAPVTYSAEARDAVDGASVVECSVPQGRILGLGTTRVVCTSEDGAGNVARKTFVVRVGDTTAPILRLPNDLRVEARGPRTPVAYVASAREPGGRSAPIRCVPASRSRFRLGTTTVRCSASDAHGNTARGTFEVRVVDTTAPQLVAPASLTMEATGQAGAKVDFAVAATDLVDGRVPATCTPASGSTFALGVTSVRCSARDASGNSVAASFTATVVDTTAPVLSVPANRTVPATSTKGAAVTYAASATDLVDGTIVAELLARLGRRLPGRHHDGHLHRARLARQPEQRDLHGDRHAVPAGRPRRQRGDGDAVHDHEPRQRGRRRVRGDRPGRRHLHVRRPRGGRLGDTIRVLRLYSAAHHHRPAEPDRRVERGQQHGSHSTLLVVSNALDRVRLTGKTEEERCDSCS